MGYQHAVEISHFLLLNGVAVAIEVGNGSAGEEAHLFEAKCLVVAEIDAELVVVGAVEAGVVGLGPLVAVYLSVLKRVLCHGEVVGYVGSTYEVRKGLRSGTMRAVLPGACHDPCVIQRASSSGNHSTVCGDAGSRKSARLTLIELAARSWKVLQTPLARSRPRSRR